MLKCNRVHKRIKKVLDKAIHRVRGERQKRECYKFYSSQFKRYLEIQHFDSKKAEGEEAYRKKWSVLCNRVDPYTYRFFCHFCGFTPNIVPEDIGHSIIEEMLNPKSYRRAYSDKNLFPLFVGPQNVPRIILCRINGGSLLDSAYRCAEKDISHYTGNIDRLILKPSVNSSSGRGIVMFCRNNNSFVAVNEGIVLTKDYLIDYAKDFCLQEAITQHSFMNDLCSSAVNTIRLCLYRSVKNDEPIITASILRIGKNGSIVDNAHAGGMFIGIDVTTGKLGQHVMDQYGNKSEIWNGVDFTNKALFIPNWDMVLDFAKNIGRRILHHRLIALDIAIKEDGKPVLIEYNINCFSYWLFMLTNQECFGDYTDEVIEYCKKRLQ